MAGKYENEIAALTEQGIDIWRPFFHRQYEGGFEGRIRRQYMDLAQPPFYPKILEVIGIRSDETILDLGCGDGTDIVNLRASGHQGRIVGMETPVSEDRDGTENKIELINQTVTKAGYEEPEIKIAYAEELVFEEETFDTIWAANVLQEVSDVDRVLDNVFRWLKPGGKLVAVTNHKDNKPFHHGKLDSMAQSIGGIAPRPRSSKFNSVSGPKVMARHRHQFRKEHEVIQRGRKNLKLTEEELPILLASLSTYWNDIWPVGILEGRDISRGELIDFLYLKKSRKLEVLEEVEEEIRSAINASPHKAVYETIKRVALLYRKRSKASHYVLNSLK
jgi:ubiquinone/menaquinone biosynthesis C-methylase UbiE